MSDKNNDQDAEFPTIEIEPEQPGKSKLRLIAWTVLTVAVLSVAGYGYFKSENWRTTTSTPATGNTAPANSDILALREELREARAALQALDDRIDAIPQKDFSDDIAAVSENVDKQLELLNTLPSRMSALENSVASLAGISQGARETFLLSEAEYYMQIANAQLQLANNPQLATLALRMADERVTQLADPALTEVRRTLSNELAGLDAMEKPDLAGASLTLASLARVVETLPLVDHTQEQHVSDADEDQGNLEAAWSSVKDAVSGLVKVTPPEAAKLAVLSPDAEHFLRSNIALQLQAARLALLRGENTIFRQTLDDTSAMLNAYFDVDSEQVGATLLSIDEVRNSVFAVDNPDISGSLRLLRQYRTLSESVE